MEIVCLLQFTMSLDMSYLAQWPDCFHATEGSGKRIMGYS